MNAQCRKLFVLVVLAVSPVLTLADQLTFKNMGEDAITLEFHRRGEKDEPRIPLPLKPGEARNLKPQEDTFYGLTVTDSDGKPHRIGYRRMKGLAVKHPGAVIEVRPQVELVEFEKEVVVMVPVVKEVVNKGGVVEKITEFRAETRVVVVTERQITGFDIVLTKMDVDDLPLEFRKFAKPPKMEP